MLSERALAWRWPRQLILLVLLLLVVGYEPAASQDDKAWLPFQQSDLLTMLNDAGFEKSIIITPEAALDPERSTLTDEQKARRADQQAKERERLSSVLAAGDTVWAILAEPGPLIITAAGRGEQVHSLRATLPVVNYSEANAHRILEFISLLFMKTYPNWDGAKLWHQESAARTWQAWSRVVDDHDASAQADLIAVHRQDGITAASFGVPPDVIIYTITTRERCVPTLEQTDNLMQRSIC
jgi:hypothetical protein